MTTFQQSILPDYINPIRYILKFSPNLEDFTFSGNETIELNISKSFNEITLHSSEIDIIDVDLSGKIHQLHQILNLKQSLFNLIPKSLLGIIL